MASPQPSQGPRPSDPSLPDPETSSASFDISPVGAQQGFAGLSLVSKAQARPRGLSTVSVSTSASSSSTVKRKPLPLGASLASRHSSGSQRRPSLEKPEARFSRRFSIDSPTLYEHAEVYPTPNIPEDSRDRKEVQPSQPAHDEERGVPTLTPVRPDDTRLQGRRISKPLPQAPAGETNISASPKGIQYARVLERESTFSNASRSTGAWHDNPPLSAASITPTMSVFSTKPPPLHLNLPPNNVPSRSFSNDLTNNSNASKPQSKSPGASKLGSFFGWGGNISPASTSTNFSDKDESPLPSPGTAHSSQQTSSNSGRAKPAAIDVPRANARDEEYFDKEYLKDLPSTPPKSSGEVEEMEEELKIISGELATSIRREMELEDLVERLQAEAANPQGPNRRTSDYFSDSGTSSVKYGGEADARTEELERLQRKADREKAQIRMDLTGKVQEERSYRKGLENRIRDLEGKASSVDRSATATVEDSGRLRELESTCEDLRRRLAEEKQVKENFEDLFTALKSDLHTSHNERDNLRDEIVPQLRARVEGLEAQAAEFEKLTYDNTKMQQELQTLKNENVSLANAQKKDMQPRVRFNSISEEPTSSLSPRAPVGLSRSTSVVHPRDVRSRPNSLSRADSVKTGESRDSLAERVKDVEAQRDALHQALKSLLERQEHQNRDNQKRIQQLEVERDRALSASPRRQGYDQEVSNLRMEINTLRRRADDAIEQKWQCEKGLSGLKMDLDRAEQEIGSLRTLLQESDVAVPAKGELLRRGSSTSDALEKAYKDLQKSYSQSLDRVKQLEASAPKDEETAKALAALEKSLAIAINERDFARGEAETYRLSAEALRGSESHHLSSETALADELRASAKRVEELATQVRQQLASNATLRQRLADTIARGETDQKANITRITHMQAKLRTLEDSLVQAQQVSEDRVAAHEAEMRTLKEAHNVQLQRLKDGMLSPRVFSPKTPLSPMFMSATPRSPRTNRMPGSSPLLGGGSGGAAGGMSISAQSKTNFLKQRVLELERALEEADREMEEVVGRMNVAQIEVMELQNEREEAVRATRRLQAAIESEKVSGFM